MLAADKGNNYCEKLYLCDKINVLYRAKRCITIRDDNEMV